MCSGARVTLREKDQSIHMRNEIEETGDAYIYLGSLDRFLFSGIPGVLDERTEKQTGKQMYSNV